jgi:hypothetical protein
MPTDMQRAVASDAPALTQGLVVVRQTMFGGRDPKRSLGRLTLAKSTASWQHVLRSVHQGDRPNRSILEAVIGTMVTWCAGWATGP